MLELLTIAEMAEADRLTIANGVPGITLMENAGRAVADCASRHPARHVLVVAGPGNNGGDGFVAARLLAERGAQVEVLLLGDRAALKGDAAIAASRWKGQTTSKQTEAFVGAELIIDALFGAGLARPIEGEAATIVEAINAAGVPVIAVDVPSGIHGDSGVALGPAVRAAETVTFFRAKPGHYLLPGRLHVGQLHIADIGIPASVIDTIKPQTVLNDPEGWRGVFPRPRTEGHKYDRGHVVVVSGGLPSTGAARLAARAALRSGAGLVTIVSPPDAVAVHAAETAAIMVREVKDGAALAQFLRDKRRNSVVVGPGGGVGSQMCEQVTAALASDAAVVLDADALTSFEGKAEELAQMIAVRTAPVVLTPHEGEFARLFGKKNDGQSKLEKTRRAASAMKAVVLLKGADTVIAAPDGHACVSAQGSPYLATAGAGDVLAGTIAGLLAQGMPAFIGACAAAWIHGEAGARLGPGLIAEDLAEVYPAIIQGFLLQSAQP